MTKGFVVAAPASGSGKTLVTLGLLRAFRDMGLAVGSAKIGPDYIDPRFHAAAAGRPCVNLDGWAMRRDRILALAAGACDGAELLVVEGVMGLFDRAAEPGVEGRGGTAEVAATLGLPVVLVVDTAGSAQSVGALADGFRRRGTGVEVAGVILNRIASARHETLVREGCAEAEMPVLGAVPRRADIATPSRHLGLVQAEEADDLEGLLARAGALIARHVDLDALRALARSPERAASHAGPSPVPPLGVRIALADDVAFRFAYPHLLDAWRSAGAEIIPFSPLADQAPDPLADAVYLPGGYPELQAGRLAGSQGFRDGMRDAAERGAAIYGECGGYMTLGEGLVDADGRRHAMLGLLPLETSFAARRLHLGYRLATLDASSPLGAAGAVYRAHEFHYASVVTERGDSLFRLEDGSACGLRRGAVFGSFLHVIDGG
ncbi:cobyrinate a,c-diamide synthase [Methylopila turkensis]|uniref:Hydrogenobyrinate a,c-diamide synthase n=1 Tax=Methylopila turkensis TaxID=1437816 RepID=A0A9W6JP10_9HYPH|nr:cobyrinate a,c-diamide synthase [Methylopila turkensis]GLK81135.1 cobyrinic acid a,c-diamide synthase [Methylopila turkensis]